ncbi:hypothetical protein BDC45DRAFT_521889 [Circinella umbellata]|nr:hypothetical protein BDC45DRAFT_521889 [Circinella umbellata]
MFACTEPIINVNLPPPILIPDIYFASGNAFIIWLDYLAVRRLQPIIGAITLRILIVLIHVSISMFFACPTEFLNASMLGSPWYIASYIVHFADKNLSFRESLIGVADTLLVFQETKQEQSIKQIRIQGLAKVARGVFKWSLMKSAVDRWLPYGYSQRLLVIDYWSVESFLLTALIGLKVYCIMGLMDLLTGSFQFMLGVPIIDIFDSPILAHSPRDFWSRRWNRIVQKIFHRQIFTASIESRNSTIKVTNQKKNESRPSSSSWLQCWSSSSIRGLAVFIISGLFHEIVLMALVRKMTFEQVLFFTLHGIAVWFEIKFGNSVRPKVLI